VIANLCVTFCLHTGAKQAYQKALEMSTMVSGANTPATVAIRALVEHTPTSSDEMIAAYNKANEFTIGTRAVLDGEESELQAVEHARQLQLQQQALYEEPLFMDEAL
jgi:hypothetical protein